MFVPHKALLDIRVVPSPMSISCLGTASSHSDQHVASGICRQALSNKAPRVCVIEFVRVPYCRYMTEKMSVHLFGSESHITGYRSAEADGVSCSWRG